ncbi:heterokaryon incompatibility protein-domain-containing protein [Rostrohypoxylon terebratum]|nr:heterokaryon incompatibility protein-domain-containing protein [Rostrohypoxylon terebratum]
MYLINVATITLHEFQGSEIPKYAILSHTWGDDEVSFQDLQAGRGSSKEGYEKIVFTCEQAKQHRLKWAWVDTCCIDKSSSAELSESINSMYRWYNESYICYAYLADVVDLSTVCQFIHERSKNQRIIWLILPIVVSVCGFN